MSEKQFTDQELEKIACQKPDSLSRQVDAVVMRCFKCKKSLEGAEIVPQSNYSLVYCPRCGEVNERD